MLPLPWHMLGLFVDNATEGVTEAEMVKFKGEVDPPLPPEAHP